MLSKTSMRFCLKACMTPSCDLDRMSAGKDSFKYTSTPYKPRLAFFHEPIAPLDVIGTRKAFVNHLLT